MDAAVGGSASGSGIAASCKYKEDKSTEEMVVGEDIMNDRIDEMNE